MNIKAIVLFGAITLAACGCILVLCRSVRASASDIYLAQTAQGAGNGADCADAHAYTFFNAAGNWGTAESQIGPGTTVHLCGTITVAAGSTALTVHGSGSAGNRVTIKFENGAVLQAPYFSGLGGINADNRSYITIDGGTNGLIQNTLNGSPGGACPGGPCSYQLGSILIHATSSPGLEIKNLTVANVYVHTQCEVAPCDKFDGTFAVVYSGSNSLIHNNVFHDGEKLVVTNSPANGDFNYRFYGNYCYNYDNCYNFGAPRGAVLKSVYVYNNHFGSMLNWDAPAGPYHKEAIHAFSAWGTGGSGAGWVQNFYMYNNLFDGNEGAIFPTSMVFLEGNANAWGGTTGTAHIWNNIIIGNDSMSNGQLAISGGRGHQIFNNTILQTDLTHAGACLVIGSASTQATNVSIENNAMQGCSTYLAGATASSFTTIDYNAYGKNIATGNPVWAYDGFNNVRVVTLSAWQSECNCDRRSVATLSKALAMNSEGVPLNDGYIGIIRGANLTSLAIGDMASLLRATSAGNTTKSISRPRTGPWDIGAYNYNPPLNPPKSLRVVHVR